MMFTFGSKCVKSFALLFGEYHDVFLHIQSSQIDYEERMLHSLRHYRVDITIVSILPTPILHERRFRFCLHLASAEKIRSEQNNDHIKEDEHTKILH